MIEYLMTLFPLPAVAAPREVIEFWKQAGPKLWFAKSADFDRRFRERFAVSYEAAARGELDFWLEDARSALALVLLLDQYPRNAFRHTRRMYVTDPAARAAADRALRHGHDRAVEPELRLFFYLPFGHSERLVDQDRSIALCSDMTPEQQRPALEHREIVRRFGRFPHRNVILGRTSTPEELEFLANGGFAG